MTIRVNLTPTQERTAKRLLKESESAGSVSDFLGASLLVVLDDLVDLVDEAAVKDTPKRKPAKRKGK